MTGGDRAQEVLAASVGSLVDELVRSGVEHFSVAPGSRSAPLALAIAAHPRAHLWMHLDERSAAFFGLGFARASRQPVALLCTSGTAAANFFPAVVEAFYGRVPLVVLTADRPHELRDRGAAQTIDQLRLYGSHVKWFFDLEEPTDESGHVQHVRTVAARAAAVARSGPAGPVHVNCPFREPLVPSPELLRHAWSEESGRAPTVRALDGARSLDGAQVQVLARDLAACERGVIVGGPRDDPRLASDVVGLARALGYPILADPLSGLRRGDHHRAHVLDAYDAFLRDEDFVARARPDVVLRFGAIPTSKPALQYLERYAGVRHVVVDGDGGWNDPSRLATEVVHADGALLARQLRAALPATHGGARASNWLERWRRTDRVARAAIQAHLASCDDLFEGRVFAELAGLLPAGATLYASSSMPVRDLDTFFPAGDGAIRFLSNRGANGIDGVVSSALGASAVSDAPLVLAIGDVALYHDSNGLLAAKQHRLNATIVLLNNDGGGIFSFLPQAAYPEHFEQLFGTPHGVDFAQLAAAYGVGFRRVATWPAFREAVSESIARTGVSIVEVPTNRVRNVAQHRAVWRAVSRALAEAGAAAAPRP